MTGLLAALRAGTLGALLLVLAPAARPDDLLIRDARVIDGTTSAPRPGVSILVRDGRIAEIGPALSAPGARILDAGGATVLPGLIDSHVHLAVIPRTVQRLRAVRRIRWTVKDGVARTPQEWMAPLNLGDVRTSR